MTIYGTGPNDIVTAGDIVRAVAMGYIAADSPIEVSMPAETRQTFEAEWATSITIETDKVRLDAA